MDSPYTPTETETPPANCAPSSDVARRGRSNVPMSSPTYHYGHPPGQPRPRDRSSKRRPSIRRVRLARALLGAALLLGLLALPLCPNAVAAIDAPALESFLRGLGHEHPNVKIPPIEVPPVLRENYGTTNQTVVKELDDAKTGEVDLAEETAREVTTDSQEDEDLLKDCMAGILNSLLELAARSETANLEESLRSPLEACLLKAFPDLEQPKELAEYLVKETLGHTAKASDAVPQEPEVFGNWIKSTISDLNAQAVPPPAPVITSTSTEGASSDSSSPSAGLIIFIVVAVGAIVVFLAKRAK
jgi:hypothetical protein